MRTLTHVPLAITVWKVQLVLHHALRGHSVMNTGWRKRVTVKIVQLENIVEKWDRPILVAYVILGKCCIVINA